MNPKCLQLELTESSMIENVAQSVHTMRAVQDLGIKVSIDDFGTGYSSLSYLKNLPIDCLKIDRSFIHNLHSGNGRLFDCESDYYDGQRLGCQSGGGRRGNMGAGFGIEENEMPLCPRIFYRETDCSGKISSAFKE